MVLARCHTWDVLHHERPRSKLGHDSQEMEHQRVAGVLQDPMPDQGETLTRGTADHDIDGSTSEPGSATDILARDLPNVTAEDRCFGKIETVGRRVDRIDLDCGNDVETSLLEPKSETPGAREQIDCNWAPRRNGVGHRAPCETW